MGLIERRSETEARDHTLSARLMDEVSEEGVSGRLTRRGTISFAAHFFGEEPLVVAFTAC